MIVLGPNLHRGNSDGEGIAQYAHAIQEALGIGNYIQVLIKLPIMDHPDYDVEDQMGSLHPFARPEYVEEGGRQKVDLLGTWDAWHVIRTVCKYNARLSVGKNLYIALLLLPQSLLILLFSLFAPRLQVTEHDDGDGEDLFKVLSFRISRRLLARFTLTCDRQLCLSHGTCLRPMFNQDGIRSPCVFCP